MTKEFTVLKTQGVKSVIKDAFGDTTDIIGGTIGVIRDPFGDQN